MLLYTCSDAKRHLRPAIAFPHSQRYRTVQLCSCAAAQGQLTRHGAGLFDHGPVEAYVLHTHRIPMSCTYTLISPAISYYQYNISVISYAAIKHAVIIILCLYCVYPIGVFRLICTKIGLAILLPHRRPRDRLSRLRQFPIRGQSQRSWTETLTTLLTSFICKQYHSCKESQRLRQIYSACLLLIQLFCLLTQLASLACLLIQLLVPNFLLISISYITRSPHAYSQSPLLLPLPHHIQS